MRGDNLYGPYVFVVCCLTKHGNKFKLVTLQSVWWQICKHTVNPWGGRRFCDVKMNDGHWVCRKNCVTHVTLAWRCPGLLCSASTRSLVGRLQSCPFSGCSKRRKSLPSQDRAVGAAKAQGLLPAVPSVLSLYKSWKSGGQGQNAVVTWKILLLNVYSLASVTVIRVKVKVKFTPEQATKAQAQRGSRSIALLIL